MVLTTYSKSRSCNHLGMIVVRSGASILSARQVLEIHMEERAIVART